MRPTEIEIANVQLAICLYNICLELPGELQTLLLDDFDKMSRPAYNWSCIWEERNWKWAGNETFIEQQVVA